MSQVTDNEGKKDVKHTFVCKDGILHSCFPVKDIPNVSLPSLVFSDVAKRKDRVALVDFATGRSLTYGELHNAIIKTAHGFQKLGMKQHEVAAMFAPNHVEWAIAFHALASLGVTVTTCNPVYTTSELVHQLKDSAAKYLITSKEFCQKAAHACDELKGQIETRIVFGGEHEGFHVFEDLQKNDATELPVVNMDYSKDVVVLPYSSGTTGLPKGVRLTHRNLVANLLQVEEVIQLAEHETLVGVLPFFHIYGLMVILNGALYKGAKVVTIPKFEPVAFLDLMSKHKVTVAHVVPPIVVFLGKHPIIDKYDLTALREVFSGAAPLGKEASLELQKRLKLESIRQGYGMTELSPASHICPRGVDRPGSVGVLLCNTEAKIVADGKVVAEPNVPGELWVRGPQVMAGYWNAPVATKETIDDDGFLHTGDIGYVDADGCFHIVDRLKELIKVKGFQVAPAELEALLLGHPSVADVAVIGKLDQSQEEFPKAFIVKKSEVSADDLIKFVAEAVAPYKKIREVEFVNSIPKNPSGKILRRFLRDEEKKRQQQQQESKA